MILILFPTGSIIAQIQPGCEKSNFGPSGKPWNRVAKPVPTHRFWAAKNWFASNKTEAGGIYKMIPDPLRLETRESGLWVVMRRR